MAAEGTGVFIGLYNDFFSIFPKTPWTPLYTNAATGTFVIIDRNPIHSSLPFKLD
jgi:hypothetical protein